MTDNEEQDPRQALAVFHRQQGGGLSLFGSDLLHEETIALTIRQAEVQRDLSHDWYHGNEVLIEVILSPAQFAELLTTMNIGDGVPATVSVHPTLGYLGRRADPPPPRETYDAEIAAANREAYTAFNAFREALETERLTARQKDRLLAAVNTAENKVRGAMPHIVTMFRERMDRVVTDAKASVEAFVTGVVTRTGLTALHRQAPVLPELPAATREEETP